MRASVGRSFMPFGITSVLCGTLFLRDYHLRHASLTSLLGSVLIDGISSEAPVQTEMDGVVQNLGDRVPIGWHTIKVQTAFSDPFTLTRWIWYGGNDLGRIDLRRARFDIMVQCIPRPDRIELSGELGGRVSADGLFTNLPAGNYTATLTFGSQSISQPVRAVRGESTITLKAPIGVVDFSSDRTDADFELLPLGAGDRLVGKLPTSRPLKNPCFSTRFSLVLCSKG